MLLNWLSRRLAAYLSKQVTEQSVRTCAWEALERVIQPGDVLLVEGNTRISVAIKYLTQSTWSHAALYWGRMQDLEPQTMASRMFWSRRIWRKAFAHFHSRFTATPIPVSVARSDSVTTISASLLTTRKAGSATSTI